jgi:hypothetical protein
VDGIGLTELIGKDHADRDVHVPFSKGLGEGGASSPLRRPQQWRRPLFPRPRALRRLQRSPSPPSEPDSEPRRPVHYACDCDSCTAAYSTCDRIDVFRPARPASPASL